MTVMRHDRSAMLAAAKALEGATVDPSGQIPEAGWPRLRLAEAAEILGRTWAAEAADWLREAGSAVAETPKAYRQAAWERALASFWILGKASSIPPGSPDALYQAVAPFKFRARSASGEICPAVSEGGAQGVVDGRWYVICRRREAAWGFGEPLVRRVTWVWGPEAAPSALDASAADGDAARAVGRFGVFYDHAPLRASRRNPHRAFVHAPYGPMDPLALAAPEDWPAKHPRASAFDGRLQALQSVTPRRFGLLAEAPVAAPLPEAPALDWATALLPTRRRMAQFVWQMSGMALNGGLRLCSGPDGALLSDRTGAGLRTVGLDGKRLKDPVFGALQEGGAPLSAFGLWFGDAFAPMAVWSAAGRWRAGDPPRAIKTKLDTEALRRETPRVLEPVEEAALTALSLRRREIAMAPPELVEPRRLARPPKPALAEEAPVPEALAAELRTIVTDLLEDTGRRSTETGGLALAAAVRGIAARRRRLPPTDKAFYAERVGVPSLGARFSAEALSFEATATATPASPPSEQLRFENGALRNLGGLIPWSERGDWARWFADTPPVSAVVALGGDPAELEAGLAELATNLFTQEWRAELTRAAGRFGPTSALLAVLATLSEEEAATAFEAATSRWPSSARAEALDALAARLNEPVRVHGAWLAKSHRLDALSPMAAERLWRSPPEDPAGLWRLACATPPSLLAGDAGRWVGADPRLARFLRLLTEIAAL